MSDEYPYHEEGWLLEELGSSTVEEIAESCDVTKQTINRWIDKHNIQQVDTRAAEEGESVNNRTIIESSDVEKDEVEVSEEKVHSDSSKSVDVETTSETVEATSDTKDFPEQIQRLGVGVCQNCNKEDMLGAHPIQAGEEESVCSRCDEYLRGCTINTKRTIINNPIAPHWNENNND